MIRLVMGSVAGRCIIPIQDYLQVVTLQEGDTVSVEYLEGTTVCTVLNLE